MGATETKIEHIEEEEDMRKLKYGAGSITQRQRTLKDGTIRRYYEGRIYREGKQISVYGSTQTECLAKLKELKNDYPIVPSGDGYKVKTEKRFRTYSDWLDEWVEQFKKGKLREDYFEEFMKKVSKVREVLGKRPINKIESLEVLRYLNSLRRCNTTVKIYDIINGSLQKAEDFGIIKRNPCRAIERPTYEEEKRRAYELAEQTDILNALNARYASVFYFLCCTGLRIGEFLALRPDDVDEARHVIRVDENRSLKTGKDGKTKTTAGTRKVYYAEALFEVFDVQTLGTFTYCGIKKAFNKVIKKLKLEGVSVTHSCRHTCASLLYAAGVPLKVMQKQLGHASISTTLDTYTDILLQGTSPIYDYILELKSTLNCTLIGN